MKEKEKKEQERNSAKSEFRMQGMIGRFCGERFPLHSFINLFIRLLSTIYLYFPHSSTYSSVSYQQFIYTTLVHQPIHPSPINNLSILPSFINLFIRLLSTIYQYFTHSSTYSSVSSQPFIYTSLIHQLIHPSPIKNLSILHSFINLFIRLLSTIYLYFPHSSTYSSVTYQPFIYSSLIHQPIHSFIYTSLLHQPIHPSPINH